MERSFGATLCSIAAIAFVAILLAAYLAESTRNLALYYGFGTVNPLLAGVLAVGVLAAFALDHLGYLSAAMGTGIALGLSVVAFLVALVWAFDGRVDVFLAPGWAFPAQRWVLTGVALVMVLGATLRAWTLDLFGG